METRVTYRTSQETVKRLQELAEKYGISQSALLTMLVNERWIAERLGAQERPPGREEAGRTAREPEPPPNFPEYVQMGKKHKHRKRH